MSILRTLKYYFVAKSSYSPYETAKLGYAFGKALAQTNPNKKWEIALSNTLGTPPALYHMGKSVFALGCLQGYEDEIQEQAKDTPEIAEDYCAFDNAIDNGQISILSMLPYAEIIDIFKPFNKRRKYNGTINPDDVRNLSRGPKSFNKASRGLRITDWPAPNAIMRSDSWVAIRYKIPFNKLTQTMSKDFKAPRLLCFSHYNEATRTAWDKSIKLLENPEFEPEIHANKEQDINRENETSFEIRI